VTEDIPMEYIRAMKFHVDNDLLNMKELNKIYKDVKDYIKGKEKGS
jgi:hypothetical protein